MLWRAVRPALKEPKEREMSRLFLLAAFAIPLFYLPALFFGRTSTFTVVDTWRFWIIHLWVEGFFELFATVMVATMFYTMGLVSRRTAARVLYLDAVLFLGAGVLGTGHHWYWTGQSNVSMAISATFSAMEVVPLILLTLDAADFVRLTRGEQREGGRKSYLPHRYTFYFLIAVGVWNFIGAGVFGFLINLPVVSYFEAGTNLTANHGHAAMMGVFGMLAVAFVVFALRQFSTDEHWQRVEKYVRVSFWGLNSGLAGMVILNLFPSGVMQLFDVAHHGYWHARSPAFLDLPLVRARLAASAGGCRLHPGRRCAAADRGRDDLPAQPAAGAVTSSLAQRLRCVAPDPDCFSMAGQLGGAPVYRRQVLRAQNYRSGLSG